MAAPALAQAEASPGGASWAASPPAAGLLRAGLDRFYLVCGGLSGVALAGIGITVVAQIVARFFATTIDSTESAGFCMATSAFFGLAYAMRYGDHIRVNLLLTHLPSAVRRAAELWCCLFGVAMIGYFTWYAGTLALESYAFGDRSPGLLAMPFWIPQLSMVFGAAALTVALVDDLIAVVRGRTPAYAAAEDAAPAPDADVSGGHSGVG